MFNQMQDVYSEVRKHKHIIVCGDNGNALGVARSLGEEQIDFVLICLIEKSHLPLLRKSKYVKTIYNVHTAEEAISILLKYFSHEKMKPFVYSCDDYNQNVIDLNYDLLKEHFFFFNCGGSGIIHKYMNKQEICLLANSCGIPIPKEEVVNKGELPKTLSYPVMTKTLMSIMGKWKGDSYICKDKDELINAYKIIESPKLLIQEFIEKKNEVAIMGFSINGGNEIFIPFQLSYFFLRPQGYSSYMYFNRVQDETLKSKVQEIIKKCNYSGCFEIEFLVTKDDK